ncbi:MAG TPA: transcriptional regulator HexR [Candidatus Competibacteraceae bacterium]|nr:transcriptional regulator HexR [Candidatus Competibacteraceae bacterium]
MLNRIENLKAKLRRSERKVAEWVLARPQAAIQAPIANVAAQAGVSEPTVIRFCRALGCEGFQEFKLKLAQSLAAGVPYVHQEVLDGDRGADLVAKVFDSASAAILRARDRLDPKAVDRAVELLANARSIQCYGHGASGIVAQDAQHKLFRLGVPVVAYSDPHVHSMAAALLEPGDVVIAISHSGRSKDLLHSARLALEAGAAVIAMTAAGSPLAELATVCLDSGVEEDTRTYIPMTSRLADLAIVDVLAVGVALRRGPALRERLEKSKRIITEKYLG